MRLDRRHILKAVGASRIGFQIVSSFKGSLSPSGDRGSPQSSVGHTIEWCVRTLEETLRNPIEFDMVDVGGAVREIIVGPRVAPDTGVAIDVEKPPVITDGGATCKAVSDSGGVTPLAPGGRSDPSPGGDGMSTPPTPRPKIAYDGEGMTRVAMEHQREDLELILQETRANIIQDILAHPYMIPSLKEVAYYNPRSASTITEHVETLVENDLVFQPAIPQGQRKKGLPNTFVTLTDKGYELLEKHHLFIPEQDLLQDEFEEVEKTEKMVAHRDALRPTVNVDYPHPLRGDGLSIVDPAGYDPDEAADRGQSELRLRG